MTINVINFTQSISYCDNDFWSCETLHVIKIQVLTLMVPLVPVVLYA